MICLSLGLNSVCLRNSKCVVCRLIASVVKFSIQIGQFSLEILCFSKKIK